jgi:hypothetical protein
VNIVLEKKVLWQSQKLPDLVDHLKDAVFKQLWEARHAIYNQGDYAMKRSLLFVHQHFGMVFYDQ